jgi:hypothetical protein
MAGAAGGGASNAGAREGDQQREKMSDNYHICAQSQDWTVLIFNYHYSGLFVTDSTNSGLFAG